MKCSIKLEPERAAPTLRVTTHAIGHRTVLEVDGEVDLGSGAVLAAAIDDALTDGAYELWIDLTPTRFMDSAGLHLLLETQHRMLELNRRLAVVCPPGDVQRLFDVAGVAGRLPLFGDRTAAHHGV